MKKMSRSKLIVILLISFVVLGIATLLAMTEVGISTASASENSKFMDSLSFAGYLPWHVEEFSLRAIVDCGDWKIFIKGNEGFGTSVVGCSYYLAGGVEPSYSNPILGEGKIHFKIIPTTE